MPPSSENHVLLQADQLCKTYPDGHVKALVDVSFVLQTGEYVAIMGPSGSGKSTLLSMLGALDIPDSGRVVFEGKPLTEWKSLNWFRSRKVGFIFQSFYLLPTLTALENTQIPMFGAEKSPSQRARKAARLLEAVGMTERASHLPSQLSVGQRQRVAIARALANDPLLLLADEPTGNLDSKTADDILDLFAKLQQQRQMTLVVVTHSEEVAHRARRIIRLKDGQIVEDASTG
jgi:putative ABC transport system ATP-binding protein